ncbi:MAG: hypothetical protein FD147_533 [Chloroflexi bacterium]|nr:MAG: hypothetical protein FD147_533 [Chloroflexota bacterium]
MNKTLSITLVVIGGIVMSALIFGAGLFAGSNIPGLAGFATGGIMGRGNAYQGYSMMGNGYNMMGGNLAANVKPLNVDQTKQTIEGYLKGLNNPDLELKEIMIFDNHAYARITEKSTDIGAMELLVDPVNLSVFPEYGPNMMWNLKYGHMSGYRGMMSGRNGMMGGNGMTLAQTPWAGVGGYNNNPNSVSATMTVTSEQAAKAGQQYLDQLFPGYQMAADADPFYGYYTIDILKDGNPAGMLSVNGFNGQIFLHTWHGTFIEISE